MSLLDGLLRDARLETVMEQDITWRCAKMRQRAGGRGTWEDPFYGAKQSLSDSQNRAECSRV